LTAWGMDAAGGAARLRLSVLKAAQGIGKRPNNNLTSKTKKGADCNYEKGLQKIKESEKR